MAAVTSSSSIFVNYCAAPNCTNQATKTCAQCPTIFYCSPGCQKKDWKAHKLTYHSSDPSASKAAAQAGKVIIPKSNAANTALLAEALMHANNCAPIELFGFKNLEHIFMQYLQGKTCFSLGSGDGHLELISQLLWKIKMTCVDPDGLKFGKKKKFFLKPQFNDFTAIPLEKIPSRSNMLISWPYPTCHDSSDYDIKAITHGESKLETIILIIDRSGTSGGDQLLHWLNTLHPQAFFKPPLTVKDPIPSIWPQEPFGIRHRFIREAPLTHMQYQIKLVDPSFEVCYEVMVIEKGFKGDPTVTKIKP